MVFWIDVVDNFDDFKHTFEIYVSSLCHDRILDFVIGTRLHPLWTKRDTGLCNHEFKSGTSKERGCKRNKKERKKERKERMQKKYEGIKEEMQEK